MMYTLETFDKKNFELTEVQWQKLKDILIQSEEQFVKIGDSIIHRSAIKDVTPNYARRDEVEKEKLELSNQNMLTDGEVGKYLLSGNVEKITDDKALRIRLKRIFYEHVKRRPMINKLALPGRTAAWERQQGFLPPEQRREKPALGFDPVYTDQEKYIIATPIEKLMDDYVASLSS